MSEINVVDYLKDLIAKGEPVDCRQISKQFHWPQVSVKNAEWMIRTGKPYYKKSRGMAIASVQNNRAWHLGLSGRVSRNEWIAVCEKYDNRCANCGKTLPLTMDHIKPLSRGGEHTVDNIQPLCKSCNSRKSNKI